VLRTRLTARKSTAAVVLAVAVSAGLTGCASGFQAFTTTQRPSGNGANANLGQLQIRDVTIVQGAEGSRTGTMLLTVVNRGTEDDALTAVNLLDPTGTTLVTGTDAVAGTLPLPAQSSTRVGYNSETHVDITGLEASPSQYVQVQLVFRDAGRITLNVMAVLPQGIYEGIAPLSAA